MVVRWRVSGDDLAATLLPLPLVVVMARGVISPERATSFVFWL
jgi:hypothetical protein